MFSAIRFHLEPSAGRACHRLDNSLGHQRAGRERLPQISERLSGQNRKERVSRHGRETGKICLIEQFIPVINIRRGLQEFSVADLPASETRSEQAKIRENEMRAIASTRRTIVSTLIATAAAATFALANSSLAAEIRVLNWQGYGTDEAWSLEQFEEATGIEVVHEYFNSEQEMLTKLRTNPGAFDVVLINSAFTRQAAEEGLIQAIDTSSMKNVADLAPGLGDNANLVFDGEAYGVAWVWGLTSFAVDTSAFDELPDTIEALWSPDNAGRVGWRDDAVEAAMLAAIATGQDINMPEDLEAIRERLRALKSQIRTFWSSENEWNQAVAAKEFDLATYWSGSASRSKTNYGLPVEFIIPKEGAIGWLDGLSIAADSENIDEAKQFIDWMIDPDFYIPWDTNVGAPASANAEANAGLPDDAFNRTVMGDSEKLANVQVMGPMAEELREQLLEIWQETKTYFQE